MTYYYYFVRGRKIERFITPMYGSWFEELTPEQREFYLANPNATVQEVINCELNPPYVPPTPDLQEYITQKVNELKAACYDSVTVTDLEYAMANAVLAGTAIAYTGDRYYTTTQAKAIMKQFLDESNHAMTVYDTYKPQIESAQSIESVDEIYNTAIGQL